MILFLLASGALAAGDPASASAPAAKPKAEKKVCRTIEITGSRMGIREVCMPASEWEFQKRQAEQVLNGRRELVDGHPGEAFRTAALSV